MTQLITYRLADALPQELIERGAPSVDPAERRPLLDRRLDAGSGACVLRHHAAARIVVENWKHFTPERYALHAWVVMPNHVHVLITTRRGWHLATIVHSWKSYTAKRIRRLVGGSGSVWQREYWDRAIRNERHLVTAIAYIHHNPVHAGLVGVERDWPWSSASQ